MPDLIETINETLLESAAEGVQSYTADGETVVSMDPSKLIELHKYATNLTALSGGKSGWAKLRTARAVPPGAGPD